MKNVRVDKFCATVRGKANLVGFAVFVFIFLLSDKLVWKSDVAAINLNGWIGLLHDFLPLYFLLLAPLFLLGPRAKYFYFPFFIIELSLQALGWFARVNFEMVLDGDWVGIAMGSSPSEMMWFVKHYATMSLFLYLLLFVGLLVFILKLISSVCQLRVTKTTAVMGVGALILFFYANQVLDSYVHKKYDALEKQIFGVNLVIDSFRHWDDFKLLASLKTRPQIPNTIRLAKDISDDVIGVIILGESAARSHWGLYGYERDTTPCMSARKSELIVFEDLITPIGSTAESMRYTFTTRTIERKDDLRFTMAQCLRCVGYDVAMFSNQERWGEWDGDESFDFAGCDPFLFMKEQGETNAYDEVLIPYYTNYLATVDKKMIVFMHLRGSHGPTESNYPKEGAPFEPERFDHAADSNVPALTKNHYDNSIWYTDKILECVICELESRHRPAWMIYFSDHGETPSSSSWRTQTDNDLWEIPFIIWTSKEFNDRYSAKISLLKNATRLALQSDQLLYGILSFCGVEGLGVAPCEDFLDPAFKSRVKRMVQGGRVEYVPKKFRGGLNAALPANGCGGASD